jgi:hypothetical protein
MNECLRGAHISLPNGDDSVNVNIEGNNVKVVFRLGETKLERVLSAAEAVNEGQRIAETEAYHNEISISGAAIAEFGRCLKECGELCLRESRSTGSQAAC